MSGALSGRWMQVISAGFAIVAVSVVTYTRWRFVTELRRRRRRKKQGSVNIGAIFGMDVGGTLTKLVYFQANMTSGDSPSIEAPSPTPRFGLRASRSTSHNAAASPRPEVMHTADTSLTTISQSAAVDAPGSDILPSLSRSQSFSNLEGPDHQEALKQLYKFMDTENENENVSRDDNLSFYSPLLNGRLHFLHLETRNLVTAVNYLSQTAITDHIRTIGCTGGGAIKYSREIEEQLDIKLQPMDELGSLLKGMDFALTNVSEECFTYRSDQPSTADGGSSAAKASQDSNSRQPEVTEYTRRVSMPKEMFTSKSIFPYLVVNVGSGVSILKVSAPGKFERVSGSSLGGGTYWGLCRLLTNCDTYEEVLDLAESGNNQHVDMLVGDIYGGRYDNVNLSATRVASSFGKIVMKEEPREGVKEEDLAIALLMMITNNIGQVAYLNAQLHNCSKIFFVGNFLRHNQISCRRLAFSIDFWSKSKMEAYFLKHEGYFGALGTFLESAFGKEVDRILSLGHAENDVIPDGAALSYAAASTPQPTDAPTVSNNPVSERWVNLRQKSRRGTKLTRSAPLRMDGFPSNANPSTAFTSNARTSTAQSSVNANSLPVSTDTNNHLSSTATTLHSSFNDNDSGDMETYGGSEDECSPMTTGFGQRVASMGLELKQRAVATTRGGRRSYSQDETVR